MLIDYLKRTHQFKKELKDNNYIDISGDTWFAAWQTSIDGQEIINTETLSITQKGQTVKIKNLTRSPENPKGGYLWEAQLQFFHGRSLMGWYFPLKSENIASKGIMFLTYQSEKRIFLGKWVGASYDGDLTNGFVVVSKNRTDSLLLIKELIDKHSNTINIVYHAF